MMKKAVFILLSVALLTISAVAVASADSPHETADVFVIGGGVISPDGAQLVRNKNGVSVRIHTSGLTPGDVVTVWGVVFNHPEACAGDCGAPDLTNPAVGASAQWVTGLVVGGSGKATFAGRIQVGDTSTITDEIPSTGTPLEDALGAEIHFVMRTHGPKIQGSIYEQMSSLNGGCPPNACVNLQAALFK